MKKISRFLLFFAIVLTATFVTQTEVKAASQYTGGLLDNELIQIGKTIGQASTAVTQLTDNNTSTFLDLNSNIAWYTFSSPVEISAVTAKFTGQLAVEFYDKDSMLLETYKILNNDGIQTLPAAVKDVSTVVLKYTGSIPRVYEWNVFTTPSVAPIPTTINWIQSGDKVVNLEWEIKGAETYNVKRSTSPGGPYILLENIKGKSYTDTTVTNGTTYYYVVSSVNKAGESVNSAEKGIKPNASQYTGGLLDWNTLQVSKSITVPGSTTRNLTDNNTGTFTDLNDGNSVWYTFSSPVEISAVVAKYTGQLAVEFYDEGSNLLGRYQLLNNDGIQTLPKSIQGVSTVALKYTGSIPRIYEWNVFTTPSATPVPTAINWIQSGDKVVKLEWELKGAESYNVKRATSSGGPYILLENIKEKSYTDTTVTNGTTYYYVVSSVNKAGESVNSAEKGVKPNASQYTGGLLDWRTLQVSKSITVSGSTTRNLTDNNTGTFTDLNDGNSVWYTFSSPVEISAVVAKYTGQLAVEFYDEGSKLLGRYQLLNNDGIQTLPKSIQGVSTVALKYTGSIPRIYEWNLFTTPLVAPVPTAINWIQSGDKVVKLEWELKGAESYNVKRATSPGGPYILLENIKGKSYTDITVANGITYYYVVSSVNKGGESVNSAEKGIKPNASQYTGGLLDWRTLQVSKSITVPGSTTRNLTDNNTGTFTDLNDGNSVWYTFSSPVEISAVVAKFTGKLAVEFYDGDSKLLGRYELLNNDGVQTLPEPIQGISTVVLKYTGSIPRVYEWNVFGKGGELPPEAPINLTATGGNASVALNWSNTGNANVSYIIKRATESGGSYTNIGTVTGTSYSYVDNDVVNGTTYYYIVTAVNEAGESGASNEAYATPKSGEVNPPDPSEEGERALLRLILLNGVEKEYDLSMAEVTAFLNWYEGRANGTGSVMYAIDKHGNNKGPFVNRKDYVFFDKIITFEVNAYNSGTIVSDIPVQ